MITQDELNLLLLQQVLTFIGTGMLNEKVNFKIRV